MVYIKPGKHLSTLSVKRLGTGDWVLGTGYWKLDIEDWALRKICFLSLCQSLVPNPQSLDPIET